MSVGKLIMGVAGILMGAQGIKGGLNALGEATAPSPRGPHASGKAGLGLAPASQLAPTTTESAAPITLHPGSVANLTERMRNIQGQILKGMRDPNMLILARKIVSGKDATGKHWLIEEKDNLAEAKAIFAYMRANVRYTSDPYEVDTFETARATLKAQSGDCDAYSATTATLLLQIGIPAELVVIQTTASKSPDHIFAACGLPRAYPTKWYAMDASVNRPFGWFPPKAMVSKAWRFKALPR